MFLCKDIYFLISEVTTLTMLELFVIFLFDFLSGQVAGLAGQSALAFGQHFGLAQAPSIATTETAAASFREFKRVLVIVFIEFLFIYFDCFEIER